MCQAFFASAIAKENFLALPPTDREPSRFAALGQAQKDRVFAVRLSGPTCCGRGPSAVRGTFEMRPASIEPGDQEETRRAGVMNGSQPFGSVCIPASVAAGSRHPPVSCGGERTSQAALSCPRIL